MTRTGKYVRKGMWLYVTPYLSQSGYIDIEHQPQNTLCGIHIDNPKETLELTHIKEPSYCRLYNLYESGQRLWWMFDRYKVTLIWDNLNITQIRTNQLYDAHLSIRIFCRQVLIRLATSGALSRRTVSMPLQSILSWVSARVKYKPAYLFLLINR